MSSLILFRSEINLLDGVSAGTFDKMKKMFAENDSYLFDTQINVQGKKFVAYRVDVDSVADCALETCLWTYKTV